MEVALTGCSAIQASKYVSASWSSRWFSFTAAAGGGAAGAPEPACCGAQAARMHTAAMVIFCFNGALLPGGGAPVRPRAVEVRQNTHGAASLPAFAGGGLLADRGAPWEPA